ncbi:MAG: outer membrane protein assembly factor BamE, partial [Proteobacteria bacterium]|nr:outer membrane protein assembly factor BamE [Pseudomonadota bacterium]
EEISLGLSKDDVVSKLGSPSSQSSFGNEAWYYVTSRKEAWAFLPYEVAQQDVTRIEFGQDGKVAKVDSYDLSSSEDVAIVKRETQTEGHSLGFFEQILGNIGRFNSPASNSSTSNNRSGVPRGR